MKTWLKGGLIGAGIGVIAWLSLAFSVFRTNGWFWLSPACKIVTYGQGLGFCLFMWGHISNILFGFIIGAIIGLIVQKIKSGKKIKNEQTK